PPTARSSNILRRYFFHLQTLGSELPEHSQLPVETCNSVPVGRDQFRSSSFGKMAPPMVQKCPSANWHIMGGVSAPIELPRPLPDFLPSAGREGRLDYSAKCCHL